jgi:hypothetical protein
MPYTPKNPSPATVKVNRESAARYDLDDRQDFADAAAASSRVSPMAGRSVTTAG